MGSVGQYTMTVNKFDTLFNKVNSLSIIGGRAVDMVNFDNSFLVSGKNISTPTTQAIQVITLDTLLNITNTLNLDSVAYINGPVQQQIEIMLLGNLNRIKQGEYIVQGNTSAIDPQFGINSLQNISTLIKNNIVVSTCITGNIWLDEQYLSPSTTSSERYGYVYSTSISGSGPFFGIPQTNSTSILVQKVDSANNLKWVKFYGEYENMYYAPFAIYATQDSGAVISGVRYNFNNPTVFNEAEGFVMKINKFGLEDFVGIIEQNDYRHSTYRCFPNPASEYLLFEYTKPEQISITIYDRMGEKMIEIGNYEKFAKIDVSAFPAGIYFYNLRNGITNYTGRFIKQ